MADAEKDKKHRSPAYPFIPLRKAVDRAQQLYERNKRHTTPLSVAVGLWGYAEKSSGGLQTVSALKQFGLLADEGSGDKRNVRLTDLALGILLDEVPGSAERAAALRRAALSPKLYAEMYERWGAELPSDETIRTFLKRDKDYNDDVVTSVINDFKDTLEYAAVEKSDKIDSASGPPEQATAPRMGAKMQSQQQLPPSGGDFEPARILLEGGGIGRVIFSGSTPTVDDIEALIDVLKIQQRQMRKKQGSGDNG